LETWFWELLVCPSARFRFVDTKLATAEDRETLRRFNSLYSVFVGLTERVASLAGMTVGLSLGSEPVEEARIGDRFTIATLMKFAKSRGWRVESCGTHVAFWKRGKVIPAAQRERHLKEAILLYRSLQPTTHDPRHGNLQIEVRGFDLRMLPRRLTGMLMGITAGMTLTMVICLPLLMALDPSKTTWLVLAVPVLGILLMSIGAVLGTRLSGGGGDF
jgi:hypothetical protein